MKAPATHKPAVTAAAVTSLTSLKSIADRLPYL